MSVEKHDCNQYAPGEDCTVCVATRTLEPEWNPDAMADKVSSSIGLAGDLIIEEIRTAESKMEAIGRLKAIRCDVDDALEVMK